WAIISAVILGMINNNIALLDMFHIPTESGASSGIVEDGISSIVNPLVFVIIILAVTQIMIASGAIDKILAFVMDKFTKSARAAELVIIFVTAIISTPISNNTAAVLLEGPGFVKKIDRKSTRLNSSHVSISYAVFCLKKK